MNGLEDIATCAYTAENMSTKSGHSTALQDLMDSTNQFLVSDKPESMPPNNNAVSDQGTFQHQDEVALICADVGTNLFVYLSDSKKCESANIEGDSTFNETNKIVVVDVNVKFGDGLLTEMGIQNDLDMGMKYAEPSTFGVNRENISNPELNSSPKKMSLDLDAANDNAAVIIHDTDNIARTSKTASTKENTASSLQLDIDISSEGGSSINVLDITNDGDDLFVCGDDDSQIIEFSGDGDMKQDKVLKAEGKEFQGEVIVSQHTLVQQTETEKCSFNDPMNSKKGDDKSSELVTNEKAECCNDVVMETIVLAANRPVPDYSVECNEAVHFKDDLLIQKTSADDALDKVTSELQAPEFMEVDTPVNKVESFASVSMAVDTPDNKSILRQDLTSETEKDNEMVAISHIPVMTSDVLALKIKELIDKGEEKATGIQKKTADVKSTKSDIQSALKIVGVTSAVGMSFDVDIEDKMDILTNDVSEKEENVDRPVTILNGTSSKHDKADEKITINQEVVVASVSSESTKAALKKKIKEDAKANVIDDDVIAVEDETKPAPKQKRSKMQTCVVCSKFGKGKYNIVTEGYVKHLCDDNCFKRFRSNPTVYFTPKETQNQNKSENADMGMGWHEINTGKTANEDSEAVRQVYKTCTVCQLMNIRTSKPFLSWQGMDFCGEECLGKFQAGLSINCGNCSGVILPGNKAKYCLRIGSDVKHFCSLTCNNDFVKRMKTCAFCNKDLANLADSFMAPVGNQSTFKDFCSQICLQKFEDKSNKDLEIVGVQNGQKASVPQGSFACAVCSKVGPVKHEFKLDSKVNRLCSDPCFSAFQYANKLTLNTCDNCGTNLTTEDGQSLQYVQFEGQQKRFCSFMCVNSFRTVNKKTVPCAWCGNKKFNFDMIERVDATNKFQLFCSLNCLSLYRVNLQATSNQAVVCDQCQKFVPAQYHLTMSDASVRNFCSYGCVMQFQAHFQTPAKQIPPLTNASPNKQTPTMPPQQQQTTRSGRMVTRGVTAQKVAQKVVNKTSNKNGADSFPIISNVVSLAPQGAQQQINIKSSTPVSVANQQQGIKTTLVSSGNQTIQQQIIIQPPPPKSVKNKSLLCKPITQTKATSCRPHTISKETQTEGQIEPDKYMIPVPVPIYCPTPLAMYSLPTPICIPIPVPIPVPIFIPTTKKGAASILKQIKIILGSLPTPICIPIPVPIPVPIFIPTTKKGAASILKQIKEIQEKIPADPLEAELLMMAEAVAGKDIESSSDTDIDESECPTDAPEIKVTKETTVASAAPEDLGEDMLQMALRMASEMSDEPVMDLESSLDPVAVNTAPPLAIIQQLSQQQPDDEDDEYIPTSARARQSKGSTNKRQSCGTPRRNPKRQKMDTPSYYQESTPSPPAPTIPPPDANFHLKYTYGVNAFKHWVLQKNSQLEQTSKSGQGKALKTFKIDILQCTADELNYALCLFVKEVRKPNGDEYAVDSIFYLCLGIQQYLFENGRIDNIFTDFYYERFTEGLNEILTRYEPKLNHAGQLVCRIEEEHLWESKQLGAHSPHVLLNSLVYFNTKYFMLKTSEDHLKLSFTHIMKHWKKTPSGRGSGTGPNAGRSVYLRYYCPTPQTKDGQKKKKEEMPVYEQTENLDNPLRCPVKLYEFYLSKCPESIKNRNDTFYLVPERSCVPDSPVWYSTATLGIDHMAKMLNRIRLVREIQEAHLHTQPIYI